MMSYVETIRLENGRFHLLDLHQERLVATIRELYGPSRLSPDIKEALDQVGEIPAEGVYKCRIVYDTKIRDVEFHPYTPRTVRSLRVVEASPLLDYHLKSSDRSQLSALASCKEDCDEVIIVRDGLITDTSYSNLVFHAENTPIPYPNNDLRDEDTSTSRSNHDLHTENTLTSRSNHDLRATGVLYTPRTPLLKGVMRRSLIEQGLLQEVDLRPEDLLPGNRLGITAVSLINAMLPLSKAPRIPLSAIRLP